MAGLISARCMRRWECGAAFPIDIHAYRYVQKPQLRMRIHRCASYMNPGVSPSESFSKQSRTFGLLPTMDNVIFYQPHSASTSQPPRLPGAFPASIVSGGSVAAIPVRQTASQLNQRNEIWKDDMIKYQDLSDPFQKRHSSDQRCRNDTIQEQGTCRDCCHYYCV